AVVAVRPGRGDWNAGCFLRCREASRERRKRHRQRDDLDRSGGCECADVSTEGWSLLACAMVAERASYAVWHLCLQRPAGEEPRGWRIQPARAGFRRGTAQT